MRSQLPTFKSETEDVELAKNAKRGDPEAFFQQIDKNITEGVFDWSQEFVFTMFQIDCPARDFAKKLLARKIRAGTNFDSDDETDSEDEVQTQGGNCSTGQCGQGGLLNQIKSVVNQATSSLQQNTTISKSYCDDNECTPDQPTYEAPTSQVELTQAGVNGTLNQVNGHPAGTYGQPQQGVIKKKGKQHMIIADVEEMDDIEDGDIDLLA